MKYKDSNKIIQRGGDLFIVDNSISDWTAVKYLEEWCQISSKFDIATGFFEIGSLLDLDGKWQQLDSIRILMGSETTKRTKKLILEALTENAKSVLDGSIEKIKDKDPFLRDVPDIVNALKSKKIECRVYNESKFHAKTYITHGKEGAVGSKALVGSSNFTHPGLNHNVELNIQVKLEDEVTQLQEWYEYHWDKAVEINDEILDVITPHTRIYSPFEVYTKALQEFFHSHELTATEWEESQSKMFKYLDLYQKEAYWTLQDIANQHGGAFLCDGVGLGKTFVGLMLIERLILGEGKRVMLLAPKGATDAVWKPLLKTHLPHIGGIGGGADFSNLAVLNHTDFYRGGDFPDRFRRIAELADVVIIDEAHHFRNTGQMADPSINRPPSRYYKLFDLLDPDIRPKLLYMLTATPINNSLNDFRHMIELFSRRDENYFSRTLGINNVRGHFNELTRDFEKLFGSIQANVDENLIEANNVLRSGSIFKSLVVQRSRSYAEESQKREKGESTSFPERIPPIVANYSIRKTYGRLLALFEEAFDREDPLFSLAIYNSLAFYKGNTDNFNPMAEGSQIQILRLIRINFLKRFESSVSAFEISCDKLMRKLIAFLTKHSESDAEKLRLSRWIAQNSEILNYASERQLELWGNQELEELEQEEDVISEELLNSVEQLNRSEYRVDEIIEKTYLDLNQVVKFLNETKKFKPSNDDKVKKLIRLLQSKKLENKKVIVFTEFADTARYIKNQLQDSNIDNFEQLDSARNLDRVDVIQRFSPYYNGQTSNDLAEQNRKEIQILVSTDMLAEGINLQDSCNLINYDIHWNPVRLMQRIGRVDRRLSPDIEVKLKSDHPEISKDRGKITYWNFLPPEELENLTSLYERVSNKTLLISETLGIEGKKLLTPDDNFKALMDFNATYEGKRSPLEEMKLEYQEIIKENPDLENKLRIFPGSVFSGRTKLSKGVIGIFFCFSLPAFDMKKNEFTEEAGKTSWYLYDIDKDLILEEPSLIVKSIRSNPNTPRKCVMEHKNLIDIRSKVLNHIKNTYLKRIDAPIGIKPSLKCWMEINQ